MNAFDTIRSGRFGRRSPEARQAAARGALAICASADALAREAVEVVGQDDDRLFSLLEQRDQMLQDLTEHLVMLRLERPTADSPLYAATERAVDDADALLTEVSAALSTSHRVTMELAARVARRTDEIRSELDAVQRASSAGLGYGAAAGAHLVDRLR
ncbi:hypothetical protein [Gemmatimonas groenlandica]|uniref:Uncharacterized protein n=1 Tax=Gemmatimonas groenlandica TaxID=2732249 RepID=A0A6M4IW62_9BACT|nr:hypothetical protein [Gemmatimonas groenlandica]QJR36431.1 hypothetical protein HKW67_13425 [Gemmatimonas groenlandica]